MFLVLKLAFRNLVRNRTRTVLNLSMVIGAFTSIILFKGFSRYMLASLETSFTKGNFGHVQIASQQVWDADLPKKKEDAYMVSSPAILRNLSTNSQVEYAGPRANAMVLLSNGDKSVGGFVFGYDPKIEVNIEKLLYFEEGSGFSGKQNFEILIGAGLQKNLHTKIGQTLTVVSQTLSGSMSSIEPEVRGVFKTGLAELDNSLVYIPIQAVQQLLGTQRVERVAVLLKDGANLEKETSWVASHLPEDKGLVAKSWREIAVLYRQVSDFYFIQNLMIETILSVLVFLGILNTVGMSIYERIGEIGTMRALGDQRESILSLLLIEGLMLGLMGSLFAIPIGAFASHLISVAEMQILMPGASRPMAVHIEPIAKDYIEAALVVCLTCFITSLWPSIKALRLPVVDALRANS